LLRVDGLRFLCDAACATRFRAGERAHDLGATPGVRPSGDEWEVSTGSDRATTGAAAAAEAVTGTRTASETGDGTPPVRASGTGDEMRGRRDAEVVHVPGRIHLDEALRATGRRPALVPLRDAPVPYTGLVSAAVGGLLGVIGAHPALAMLAAAASFVAVGFGVWRTARTSRDASVSAWVLPAVGAALTLIAGPWSALDGDPGAWTTLVGGALAAATVALRPWLDARARAPVEALVARLEADLPSRVRVARTGDGDVSRTEELPLTQVRVSDELVVGEGETVAADGVVLAGSAAVLPHPGARGAVVRRIGDTVLAGARVVEGALRVAVARAGPDRAVMRTQGFATVAPGASPPLARSALTAVRLGPSVAGALAALTLLTSGGEGPQRLASVGAVLLAFPLSTLLRAVTLPALAAAAAGALRGCIYATPQALDRAGRTAVAVLCGHGTVTLGRPEVVEVHSFGSHEDAAQVLALAAGAEMALGSHPVAEAIRRCAEARGLQPIPVRRATAVPGRGVTAIAPGGERLVLGTRQLLLDDGVSVAIADGEAARAEARGRSVVFAALGGRVRALLVLEDELRPGARSAVQRLIDLGCEVVLLSGDHRPTVETLAKQLGIDHVRAELSPEERGAELRRLREGGPVVAAVGRPGHDDPVLAQADVPVGLGVVVGAAADRGISIASDDVRDAADALWIARAARQESMRAVTLLAGAGLLLALGAGGGILAPAAVAVLGLAVEGYALPAGLRLLRRMELRLPTRA
jgi:cation transport ATPase